jgi:hypothetical protein
MTGLEKMKLYKSATNFSITEIFLYKFYRSNCLSHSISIFSKSLIHKTLFYSPSSLVTNASLLGNTETVFSFITSVFTFPEVINETRSLFSISLFV